MKQERKCGNCEHYLGGGDWNLCCDLHHPGYPCGFLCYAYDDACDMWEEKNETKE
ncbi:MAG: hypothetical protein J5725_10350 [Bacteroidales bacterium]|nr:hypothetical protein [Bacteroidales bacterium]